MFGQNKSPDENLKDSSNQLTYPIKDARALSYNKYNKLVIALYMVTDIVDSTEPIRNKLRTLGTEVISDIYLIEQQHTKYVSVAESKINEIMSFLDIASTVHLISPMNAGILKKEFSALVQSIKEYGQTSSTWLEQVLENPDDFLPAPEPAASPKNLSKNLSKNQPVYSPSTPIGHKKFVKAEVTSTRLGVQTPSTLMKALSDKKFAHSFTPRPIGSHTNFDILKDKRREDIIRIVKDNSQGLTITDIKNKAKGLIVPPESLIACSEKTLQRELVSMVRDGLLKRAGEKRWSRYFAPVAP